MNTLKSRIDNNSSDDGATGRGTKFFRPHERESSVPFFQARLPVGPVHDRFEQEADTVANGIMHTPQAPRQLQASPTPVPLQRMCAACENENEEKQAGLQRKAHAGAEITEAPPLVNQVLQRQGHPLDTPTRTFMEQRIGYDFSQVRVHTGTQEAQSAQGIAAQAYTSGNHIVFNHGQYQPHTPAGKKLLAHELTHTVQQQSSVKRLPIQRSPHPPQRSDCAAQDDYIRLIVVNQETPQTLTIFWNASGQTETDTCSTGKGTCCVGNTASDDVVGAQTAASRQSGSHWTPIGVRTMARIINLGAADQRRYWSEFDDPRDIAIHAYNVFDGTPLSHGCVRTSVEMARKVYCGSMTGRTRVEVRGFARPRCNHPAIQNEWLGDGITTIPRCRAQSGLGTEVERLQRVPPGLLNQPVIDAFRIALGQARSVTAATAAAQTAGTNLWTTSHGTGTGSSLVVDDRPLYWTRNFIIRELREWTPVYTVSASARQQMIDTFEQTSRGLNITTLAPVPAGTKRILITGFDPFGMDDPWGRAGAVSGMTVGNTSGAVILALDGRTITGARCDARIQGAMMPVRYADFNQGVVENYTRNFIQSGNTADMIITISRNRDDGVFELERFAARARGGHPDNAGQSSNQAALNQSMARLYPGSTHREEFTTSTLPRSSMQPHSSVRLDDTYDAHLPGGTHIDQTTHSTPPPNAISDRGSGGDFLSNEIFYRVSMLQLNEGTHIPMGHLHVPAGTHAEYPAVVGRVRQIIISALDHSLCPPV